MRWEGQISCASRKDPSEHKGIRQIVHSHKILRFVGKILEILQANDVETEIKEASIFALQSMKIRRAVTPILSLINDMQSPSGLRLAGVKAIGFLGDSSDESVVNTLSSIFQNETGEIYETAISVIGKVGLVQFSDDFLGSCPFSRLFGRFSIDFT